MSRARGRILFHWIAFVVVALALGAIVLVSARLLSLEPAPGRTGYPQVVLPAGVLLLVAMGLGWLRHRWNGWLRKRCGWPLVPILALGLALELVAVWLGVRYPTLGLDASLWPRAEGWATLLLAYAFAASVLPARVLREPRDLLSVLLACCALSLAVIRTDFGAALIAMLPVTLALTLLDWGTRWLRRSIEAAGTALRLRLTSNQYVTAGLACTAIAAFAF